MKQKPFAHLIQKFVTNKYVFEGQIALTNRCNEDCIHCLICKKHPQQLSTHESKNAIQQLRDLGCMSLNLSGGEPLLHPGFFEIATFAKKLNIDLSINSNGTLITNAIAKRIQALQPNPIQISLYASDKKTHDQTTRMPGSYSKTISAIEQLRKLNVKVAVANIVMRHNFDHCIPLRRYARKIKARYGFDTLLRPMESGNKTPLRHRINNDQLQRAFDLKLINIKKPSPSQSKKPFDTKHKLFSPLSSMYISYDGNVYPNVTYLNKAGNIRAKTLRDIWFSSEVFHQLRNAQFKDFQCSRCRYIRQCCPDPGLSFAEHGNFFVRPREFCRIVSTITADKDIDSWIQKK